MNITLLNGEWTLNGAKIKTKATIPGDFHSALLKNNLIPDPFYGFNEKKVRWVGNTDWTIERTFEFNQIENARAILQLSQADTFFTLYINNKVAGKGQNAFTRYRFDITDYVKNGANTIKILFESTERKAEEIEDNLPYPVPYMKYDVYSPNRNLVRKCQCNGGWDWGPCIMVSGIYDDIFIEQVKDGQFDYALIDYEQDKKNIWQAHVKAAYYAFEEQKKLFDFTISGSDIESVTVTKEVNLHKGLNTFEADLTVKNPKVWKTSSQLQEEGLKYNEIYKLNICTNDSASGKLELNKNICFSTLKCVSEKDFDEEKPGRSLYFENLGRKIFAKGSNWIPLDSLPSRYTKENYQDLLESVVKANQNCIRVWGGGIYENEDFYDLCDLLGIIVWQDFMFACATYPASADFFGEVEKELSYQIPRLQSHACIGLWCGNNENYGALGWFPDSIAHRDRYLADYIKLYSVLIPNKLREYDKKRLYWASSPSAGPDDFDDNWHTDNKGDMHYWSVWHEKKDKENYMTIRPRFVSEFGYESFPSLACINKFASKEDQNFTSHLMEYHQRSPSGNSIMLENFSRYFQFPNGFENMVYLSQLQQALAIKTAVDWWRSLKPHCMGALIWQTNDVWPGPSWSSIEYGGKWKLLHYESKKFFENVYLSLFIKDKKLHAIMLNDTNSRIKVDVTISFIKFDGSQYSKPLKKTVNVKKDDKTDFFTKNIDTNDSDSYFIYAEYNWTDNLGKVQKRDTVVFPAKYKYCNLPKTDIEYQIKEKDDEFEITLYSKLPAFYLSLDSDNIRGIFSDNMFYLKGNEKKTVSFKAKDKISLSQFEASFSIKHLRETY